MSETLKFHLEKELDEARWGDLLPHAGRGGLFLVHGPEPLLDVAEAIVTDDAPTVAGFLARGVFARPTDAELGVDAERMFRFIILQPYVLAEPLAG